MLGQCRGTPKGRISLLKALLKNLLFLSLLGQPGQCISPLRWVKALLSSCLVDNDYVLTPFTSLEVPLKIVMPSCCSFLFYSYVCGCATVRPCVVLFLLLTRGCGTFSSLFLGFYPNLARS